MTKINTKLSKNRSFVAAAPSIAHPWICKGMDATVNGAHEPDWPSIEDQKKMSRDDLNSRLGAALNWYTNTQTDMDIMNAAYSALSLNPKNLRLINQLKKSSGKLSITAAKLIRMAHRGFYLPYKERKYLVKEIRKVLKSSPKNEESSEDSSKKKPNIQTFITAKIRRIKGEIDCQFDEFIVSGYKNNSRSIFSILTNPETTIPVTRKKDLIAFSEYYLSEFQKAYENRLPFVEGYSHMSKRELKASIGWWEQAITDISLFGKEKMALRKKKMTVPKPSSVVVGKLKYLKEFKALNLKSIDPVKIIGATDLWVYSTRLRKLSHYVALPNTTLDVRGTKIVNLDTQKSIQKILRRPAEQLKQFDIYKKPGVSKWFSNIHAVSTVARPSLTPDSILLKISN